MSDLLSQFQDWTRQQSDRLKEYEEKQDRIISRIDMLQAEFERPEPVGRQNNQGVKDSPGSLIATKDAIDFFQRSNRLSVKVGSFFLTPEGLERKTLIDSSALGSATPGVLRGQRDTGIQEGPRRRLTLGTLFRRRPTNASSVEFLKENGFTGAASPQAEGQAKAEATRNITIDDAPVRTIAVWLPLTKQALADLPELRRYVDNSLLYDLALREETELLSGDGLGNHISGLTTVAGSYVGTYNVSGDNRLDRLRHAILELEAAEETPDFVVVHPRTAHDIDLIKDQDNNIGNYVVVDPIMGVMVSRTIWGKTLVVTNSMPANSFLVGDSRQAEIRDRMEAMIDISESHDDYFVKNKVAILAEERLAFPIYRTSAFLYGSF